MARIQNTTDYPVKATPVLDDYIIGTDSQDSLKTVSFRVGDIADAATAPVDPFFTTLAAGQLPMANSGGQLVYSGATSTGVDYTFEGDITASSFTVSNGGFTGGISGILSANRTYTLQDASGTLALTTDVEDATWGGISGTLSDQIDLQSALDAKLDLSGGVMTGTLEMEDQDLSFDNGSVVMHQTGATDFHFVGPQTWHFISSLAQGVFELESAAANIGDFYSLRFFSDSLNKTTAQQIVDLTDVTAAQENAKIVWSVLQTGTQNVDVLTINADGNIEAVFVGDVTAPSLIVSNGGFTGTISGSLTADRTYTLQDASGTLAFTSDITGLFLPLAGGTMTGDITMNLNSIIFGTGESISRQGFALQLFTTVCIDFISQEENPFFNFVGSSKTPGDGVEIRFCNENSIDEQQTYAYLFGKIINPLLLSEEGHLQVQCMHEGSENSLVADFNYDSNLGTLFAGDVKAPSLTVLNGGFDGVISGTLTANRAYTLQDASGTLALTSDITGLFLPLSGGTMTGDIKMDNNEIQFDNNESRISATNLTFLLEHDGKIFEFADTAGPSSEIKFLNQAVAVNDGITTSYFSDQLSKNMVTLVSNLEDVTATFEEGSYKIQVLSGGVSDVDLVSFNENEELEVFIYNNIRFNNLSTGGDPVLTSNSTDKTLDLVGNLQLGTNKLNFTTPTASIYSDNTESALVLESESFLFNGTSDLNTIEVRGTLDGNGEFSKIIFQAENSLGQLDYEYASITTRVVDALNPDESGGFQFNVRSFGTLTNMLSINTFDAKEIFIGADQMIFDNKGTGANPTLSSNDSGKLLFLEGSLAFDSELMTIGKLGTNLILNSSDDFVVESFANLTNLTLRTLRTTAGEIANFKIQAFNDNLAPEEIDYFTLFVDLVDPTDGDEESNASFSVYHDGVSEQIIGLNTHGNRELFIKNNIEWQNNADDGQLILTTDSDDDLTFDGGKVVAGVTTQRVIKTGGAQATVSSASDVLITNLEVTLPNRPGRRASVRFSPSVTSEGNKKVIQFVFNEGAAASEVAVEATRVTTSVGVDDTPTTYDYWYYPEMTGQRITVSYVSNTISVGSAANPATVIGADGFIEANGTDLVTQLETIEF